VDAVVERTAFYARHADEYTNHLPNNIDLKLLHKKTDKYLSVLYTNYLEHKDKERLAQSQKLFWSAALGTYYISTLKSVCGWRFEGSLTNKYHSSTIIVI